jgi:hypothetical protein
MVLRHVLLLGRAGLLTIERMTGLLLKRQARGEAHRKVSW